VLYLLLHWTVDARPSRDEVALVLAYLWLRLAAAWGVRLFGGQSEAVWPIAEQGGYVLVFALAGLWSVRRARVV